MVRHSETDNACQIPLVPSNSGKTVTYSLVFEGELRAIAWYGSTAYIKAASLSVVHWWRLGRLEGNILFYLRMRVESHSTLWLYSGQEIIKI